MQANATLLTGPQAKQPGLAAADLAAANGYCGLAAYLAQMLLVESYDRHTDGAVPLKCVFLIHTNVQI